MSSNVLTDKQTEEIRTLLESSENPLIFFHDDADGIASFLLLWRFLGRGHGVIVKSNPRVKAEYLRKVDEYSPDKIFIVDLALIDEDFVIGAKEKGVDITQIDHHAPLKIPGLRVFNSRLNNANVPASQLCYEAVNCCEWIAAFGITGDWHLPPFRELLEEKYPGLLPMSIKRPEDALFSSPLGELVKIISFSVKGPVSEAMKSVKALTRVKSPYDILRRESKEGRFIFSLYEKYYSYYDELLSRARKTAEKSGEFLFFSYEGAKHSFSKELANELLYLYPDKIVVVARRHNNEFKMSIRTRDKPIPPVLNKALEGVDGYGGGHEFACGACIKEEYIDKLIRGLKEGFRVKD